MHKDIQYIYRSYKCKKFIFILFPFSTSLSSLSIENPLYGFLKWFGRIVKEYETIIYTLHYYERSMCE